MYENLLLEHFKGFKELDLELRPLTLLSGLNEMGKSSVIQSLLLLRQSYLQRTSVTVTDGNLSLILNGDLIELGTGQDVFFNRADYVTNKFELTIGLTTDLSEVLWRYQYDKNSDVLTPTREIETPLSEFIYETSLFTDDFHYLQAERMGPRTSFSMSDYMVRQRRQLGNAGEYTAHYLYEFQRDSVVEELWHETTRSASRSTLFSQVTAWMSEISPGTQIEPTAHTDMDIMGLRFGFPGTESFRSTNVGFGITYTLPVLVALLSSKPGGLVLLENPEAHLHPRGQSRIGELIARAASADIQVVLETHSDHILNGIRIAARNGVIDPEKVALHFFQRPEDDSSIGVEVVTPRLDSDGRLDFRPEGFFDEFSNSMRDLM